MFFRETDGLDCVALPGQSFFYGHAFAPINAHAVPKVLEVLLNKNIMFQMGNEPEQNGLKMCPW
jgi:hypothetical protein